MHCMCNNVLYLHEIAQLFSFHTTHIIILTFLGNKLLLVAFNKVCCISCWKS